MKLNVIVNSNGFLPFTNQFTNWTSPKNMSGEQVEIAVKSETTPIIYKLLLNKLKNNDVQIPAIYLLIVFSPAIAFTYACVETNTTVIEFAYSIIGAIHSWSIIMMIGFIRSFGMGYIGQWDNTARRFIISLIKILAVVIIFGSIPILVIFASDHAKYPTFYYTLAIYVGFLSINYLIASGFMLINFIRGRKNPIFIYLANRMGLYTFPMSPKDIISFNATKFTNDVSIICDFCQRYITKRVEDHDEYCRFQCGHVAHTDCYSYWFLINKNCLGCMCNIPVGRIASN